MRRKHIDQILEGHLTYRHATLACKVHFVRCMNRGERLTKDRLMDHQVRDAWVWFWLGWFRQ